MSSQLKWKEEQICQRILFYQCFFIPICEAIDNPNSQTLIMHLSKGKQSRMGAYHQQDSNWGCLIIQSVPRAIHTDIILTIKWQNYTSFGRRFWLKIHGIVGILRDIIFFGQNSLGHCVEGLGIHIDMCIHFVHLKKHLDYM